MSSAASRLVIAGVLHLFRFTAGAPQAGEAALLSSVAAVVIGGTNLFGGEGDIMGAVVGSLIIAVLQTGLVILNIDSIWQFIVVGVVIIIAVLVNQLQAALERAASECLTTHALASSRERFLPLPHFGGGASGAGASLRESAMAEPILTATGMNKHFGGLTAVDNVDFAVYPGEVVALLGDNGAGKSTLIKCISGVYRPEQGKVEFNGADITHHAPADIRSRGIETIYQDLALAENLDVGANVFLGKEKTRRLFGIIPVTDDNYMRAEAETALDELDIHIPSLKQKLVNLSGGQRQAVAIARAMYWQAKLVIMDEPTAALGVPEQRKVLALIRSLREGNIPVILISHTMHDVMAVADRMVVMRRGRIVANISRAEATEELIVRHIVGAGEAV